MLIRKTEVTSVIVQCACKKNEIINIITGLVLKSRDLREPQYTNFCNEIHLTGLAKGTHPEEERPCLSKYWKRKNIFPNREISLALHII